MLPGAVGGGELSSNGYRVCFTDEKAPEMDDGDCSTLNLPKVTELGST